MTLIPKNRTIAIWSLFILGLMVISLALRVFLNDVEPWSWVAVAFQSLAVLICIVMLIRIVRGQRDAYWRERGKSPR